ncbi:MAG TPA: hypothetical protein VF691_02500 [Cytophagaceae bacterium]|jgi:hypothetical protein
MILTLYFSIKEKKMVNITKKYLGWGDVLFLFTLCFLFPLINYLLFYLLTLSVVIARQLIIYLIKKQPSGKIPLAGIQAFILAMLFLSNILSKTKIPFTDSDSLLAILAYGR